MGLTTLGDVTRVLLRSSPAADGRSGDPAISEAFRRAGVFVEVATTDAHPRDSFDVMVALGDPRPAAQAAVPMGLPILSAASPEHLLSLVDRLDDLVVRCHWVTRLRLDEIRTRVVFSDLRVTSTATAVPIDVHDRRSSHRLAAFRYRARDPFTRPGAADGSLEATCVGERPDGSDCGLPVPNRTVLTMRPGGRRERLRVSADRGRYQALADHVELGPARAIRIARPR